MANSTRKCKQCQEYKPAADGIKAPAGWFCCHSCAIDFARKKSRKLAVRKAAAQHRERKMEVKPLSYWMKRAQQQFNAWVRERDAGQPCISCGRHHQGQYHAGHYRPAGSNPELRFEPDNTWKQCSVCNAHLSGNLTEYRKALIAKIGLARVEWLEGFHEPKRYRKEDYQAIEAEYKEKLKVLRASHLPEISG